MTRRHTSVGIRLASLLIIATVSACGGGGDDGGEVRPATVSTLAYVLSECRADLSGGTIRQRLEIRRGEQAPLTVFDTSRVELPPFALNYCRLTGRDRRDWRFWRDGVVRRLGVTPDGSRVVYEATDEQSGTVFPPHTIPPEKTGIFVVGADGRNPRRLAAASHDPPGSRFVAINTFAISPSGRTIAYTDIGPGRDNQEAVQIFTLDLVTAGASPFQVTTLPPGPTCCPTFIDEQTIAFSTRANVDCTHREGEHLIVTVKTDGTNLECVPPPDAIEGAELDPIFQITGADVSTAVVRYPGQRAVNAGNYFGEGSEIKEVFVFDREDNVLQLTNFERYDLWQSTLSADGQRVFFSVSGNPLGTNPSENCQIYSIDRTGGDLRQLTQFSEGPHASTGCDYGRRGQGCGAFALGRDTLSDALVFDSMCDPFGTNPNGSQIFAMHPDGTGLRQITDSRGFVLDENGGSVTVELAFPFAFPGQIK